MTRNGDTATQPELFDAIVVGAGFGGMHMLHSLRGMGLRAVAFETGTGVGGTWFWNRYPGARCDVESMQYSYSWDAALQKEWRWTERYASQPEILAYANHVADRFDLTRDIRFETRVEAAEWDAARAVWRVRTSCGGRTAEAEATWLILATGCLSAAKKPEIPGLDDFAGPVFHTGDWPHEGVDFAGKSVAVIGTGSSGIQAIPEIARQAASLTVFQRTPNYSIPASNRPLEDADFADWQAHYEERRRFAREQAPGGILYEPPIGEALTVDEDAFRKEMDRRWIVGGPNFRAAFTDVLVDEAANTRVADYVRDRVRAIVKDPETAEDLCPTDYPIFTKRICVDTGYFETFNRPNVSLVNLRRTPIEAITPAGVRTTEGETPFDAIVCATGFDAMTGAILAIDIRGEGGVRIADKWAEGPRAYLGLALAGFPNMFTITGPGSPSVLSNMIVSIEYHVELICRLIEAAKARQGALVAADREAEDAWVAHCGEVAAQTLYPRAASWYMGANVPGKPRVFMPYLGVDAYRRRVEAVAAEDWRGFDFAPAGQGAEAPSRA
ncbi:MAG: cyclohexanone monooxygenase [Rhodobacteraceae bacterium]|nr:cyclohexanone monooxygenase [Paracoccaceae bacterium]MBR26833.1 cyclohexanone monooxygenase [Paracoccaceae bacterium]